MARANIAGMHEFCGPNTLAQLSRLRERPRHPRLANWAGITVASRVPLVCSGPTIWASVQGLAEDSPTTKHPTQTFKKAFTNHKASNPNLQKNNELVVYTSQPIAATNSLTLHPHDVTTTTLMGPDRLVALSLWFREQPAASSPNQCQALTA